MILDGEFAGIFLVLLLLEGVSKPPDGAMVVRRFGFGAWRIVGDTGSKLRLTSLLPPFSTSLVIPARGIAPVGRDDLIERWKSARRACLPLHVLGILLVLSLVVGLPLAAVRLTSIGFILAAIVVGILTMIQAMAGAGALKKVGVPLKQANRRALRWISPFAAPGTAETVLQAALANASQAQVAQLLLPDTALRAWLRPLAYDLMEGRVNDPELSATFSTELLKEVVTHRPSDIDPSAMAWCPRCGSSYRTTGDCTDCGVPLLATSR